MYLKKSIIISELDDGFVAIDSDVSDDRFNGMVKLNETAKEILEILKEDISQEELIERFAQNNDTSVEEVKEDIIDIVNKLKEIKYIVS